MVLTSLAARAPVTAALIVALASAAPVAAQTAAPAAAALPAPHSIVIRLIERPGPMPYAFDPAEFTAERGDTLRFIQAASVMHNVHFKTVAKGAHLGGAVMSPYLTTKGQTYVVVLDGRFTNGRYEIVCDPHELVGMHAFLTVDGESAVPSGGK